MTFMHMSHFMSKFPSTLQERGGKERERTLNYHCGKKRTPVFSLEALCYNIEIMCRLPGIENIYLNRTNYINKDEK